VDHIRLAGSILGQTGIHGGQDFGMLSGGVELLQICTQACEPVNRS
jgi:hypothetical protein